mgnify:CR=1 FL=1
MAAARNALTADGHTVSAVTSLSAADLTGVDILWLPLLDSEAFYTQAERDVIDAYLNGGGRLFWIGDAGIYNLGDDSLLSIFGVTKLSGTYDTDGPVLAAATHPVKSGPHGTSAGVVAVSATFGLMDLANASAPTTALYTDSAGPGAFIALVERTPGAAAGRAALVCDSAIFADALDEGAGHRTLLRNLVAWLARRPGYTPSGSAVSTGDISGAGSAFPAVKVTLSQTTSTGFTTVTPLAGGAAQCDFSVAPFTGLADRYVGFGFQIATTAGLGASPTATITVTYDEAAFVAGGFRDEAAVQLFRYDSAIGSAVQITTGRDLTANTLTGSAGGLGFYLVGVVLNPADCDANGVPDACEIEAESLAAGGPFYCVADCDSDCNENGIPDACDVRTRYLHNSPTMTPIGVGAPKTHIVTGVPRAVSDVTLQFFARGDFSATSEYLTVQLNGAALGRVFETGAGADCPATPITGSLVVSKTQFNTLVSGGDATIVMTASAAVDPNLCSPPSSISVRLDYEAESVGADCNSNGIPDDCETSADCNGNGQRDICEIASGAAQDCDGNGVPDACDISSGAAEDCNGNEIPDGCEPDARLTMVRSPVEGGSVQPIGAADYELCSSPTITATPAAGYCFTGWTVSAGAPPANPSAATTTIPADFSKTVTANFTKIITAQPVQKLGCPGGSVTFTVTVDPALAGQAAYQWRRDGVNVSGASYSGANAAQLVISPVNTGTVGAYDCVVTLPCGTVTSQSAALGIGGDTTLTTDLPPTTTVCTGQTATLTVAATGVELTYRWQKHDGGDFADMTAGPGVSGVSGPQLVMTGAQASTAGQYRCKVSGTCGGEVISAVTTVVVAAPPVITASGASQTLCEDEVFVTSVTATGANLVYEWWFSSGGNWRALTASDAGVTGFNTPTLTIQPALPAHTGSYRCIVSGNCTPHAQSDTVPLTVRAKTRLLTQPTGATKCPGNSTSFTVVATGTNIAYQWQFDGGGGFGNLTSSSFGVSGFNSATLSIPSVGAIHAGQYRCVITGDCGATVNSDSALLSVTSVTTISNASAPADTASCPGGRVVFAVEATGSGLTYQWQANTGPAFLNLVDGPKISGARSATLVMTGVAATDAGRYQCVVAGACGSAQVSRAALLSITSGVCDCNSNSVSDADDIVTGYSVDCNANGIPDECELTSTNPAPGGPFFCTVGCLADCNENGIPDSCDISAGFSTDCNANGQPDECEAGGGGGGGLDCNSNGVPDACDIASGISPDCNKNGVPDECEAPYVVDAGPDVVRCAGMTTVTLGGATVASGSRSPYQYQWSILSGPSGATLQTPTSMRPIFHATQAGDYVVQLRVSDATVPPCVKTDTVNIQVYAMTVDAGPAMSVGVGRESPAMSPMITGASGSISYAWTILPGSPSVDVSQFTGGGAATANPTFTPTTPGRYTLKLTASDSNNPVACEVSDTLTLDSVLMTMAVPADFAMCAGGESAPLAAAITSPGVAPYSYAWTIEPGSPSVSISQFVGTAAGSIQPKFRPASTGLYTLRLTITDASTPPATQTATMRVGVGGMTVSIPDEIALCASAQGITLPRPNIVGGVDPVTFNWTLEPGSPSNDPGQFSGETAYSAEWVFSPRAAGSYRLRLTSTDSASPPCIRTNELIVRSTAMSINAGADFVTQAFHASQPLGALPLVAGGGSNMRYEWRILSGPSTKKSQLSSSTVARPVFTPSDVGMYAIEVTATDEDAACSVTDVVAVEAITASRALPANAEGRVFISLRIDEPHTAAEIRIAGAAPNVDFTGEIRNAGGAARFEGLQPEVAIGRRLTLATDAGKGEFVALVGMMFSLNELDGSDPETVVINAWDGANELWRPAVGGSVEAATHPLRPTKSDVGRRGWEKLPAVGPNVYFAWAVVDFEGDFALGRPAAGVGTFNPDGNDPGDGPSPIGGPPSVGGMCGVGAGAAFLPLLGIGLIQRRAVRKRRSSRRTQIL